MLTDFRRRLSSLLPFLPFPAARGARAASLSVFSITAALAAVVSVWLMNAELFWQNRRHVNNSKRDHHAPLHFTPR